MGDQWRQTYRPADEEPQAGLGSSPACSSASSRRRSWILHEKSRRQILYRDFIEEASKCYIDALQHGEADIPGLVGLYAKLSAMRAMSSKTAVQVARKILDTYLEPDKSFVELREMTIDSTIDLLRGFSEACHDEFEAMRPKQF